MGILPICNRGENKKYLSCHRLAYIHWNKQMLFGVPGGPIFVGWLSVGWVVHFSGDKKEFHLQIFPSICGCLPPTQKKSLPSAHFHSRGFFMGFLEVEVDPHPNPSNSVPLGFQTISFQQKTPPPGFLEAKKNRQPLLWADQHKQMGMTTSKSPKLGGFVGKKRKVPHKLRMKFCWLIFSHVYVYMCIFVRLKLCI